MAGEDNRNHNNNDDNNDIDIEDKTPNTKKGLSFSINSILNASKNNNPVEAVDQGEISDDAASGSEEEDDGEEEKDGSIIKVPAHRPPGGGPAGLIPGTTSEATVASFNSAAASMAMASMAAASDFSPWSLYRPLPGYLPLQTSFLTSKFAGK